MRSSVLFIVLGGTLIIYIMKGGFGLSLLKDEWCYFLIALNIYMSCLNAREFKSKYKYLMYSIGSVMIVICCLVGIVTLDDIEYHYMDSPKGEHRLVLKEYTEGFRPDGYLEVYELRFMGFKKKVGNTLCVKNWGPLIGVEFIPKENNVIRLGQVYTIDSLGFEWIDEDTLHITYKYIDNLKETEKKNAQSVVKL